MSRGRLQLGGVLAAIAGLLLFTASPAAAITVYNGDIRASAQAVGSCGNTTGNFVKGVQLALWSGSLLSTPSEIDGYWGPNTNTAIRNFQSRHGLTVDGCFGYNSWSKLQYASDTCNGFSYPHMVVVSYDTYGQPTWRYSEAPCHSTRSSAWTDWTANAESWELSNSSYVSPFCLHTGWHAYCYPFDGS